MKMYMYDRPFQWWVQSVMPLVFDDSLSYYEVLAKLTKYIEGLTGDVEQIEKILGTIEGIEDVTQFTEFLERIQVEIGNLENLQTDTKVSLVSAINEVALKADIAYWKPPTGIPESDLSQEVRDKLNRTGGSTEYIINGVKLNPVPSNNSPTDLGLGTYTVPDGGIPWNTLSSDVRDRITGSGSGGTTNYDDLNNKPQINGHTLSAGDNSGESLGLGNYDKPVTGIPESDLSAAVQEKLNTSGNIADSEATFVATRDYQPGELIYINGKLYKARYLILTGTNLIPGNNIEETDISNEIERINGEIDALQSGSGPDSWSLVANLTSNSTLTYVNFFEYFNATGGENYLFICTPTADNESPYEINILKRDGTVVYTTGVLSYTNQERFTFAPVDTGEYYCRIRKTATSPDTPTDAKVKVELEYTQSQGISELWAQVNEAAQLEPRVSAVENLVSQQQTVVGQLTDIPARMTRAESDIDSLEAKIVNETNGVINAEQVFTCSVNTGGDLQINVGGINNNGADTALTTRCRTRYFDVIGNRRYMVKLLDSNYVMMKAFQYSTPPNAAHMLEGIPLTDNNTIIFNTLEDAHFVRISFARVNTNENITDEDRNNILSALKLYSLTDTTLTQSGSAADAKITGGKIAENRDIINAHASQEFVSIENAENRSWYMAASDGHIISSSISKMFYIPCVKNTLYRIDHERSGRFIVGCFNTRPVVGSVPTNFVKGTTADGREDSTFIVSGSDSLYLGVYYYSRSFAGDWTEGETLEAISVYTNAVDETLMHEGIPADSKAVGEALSEIPNGFYSVKDDIGNVATFDEVIDLYDKLLTLRPDYVTKNTLSHGNVTNYEYVFSTPDYNDNTGHRTRDSVIAKPTILMIAGIHGYERAAVMSLYGVMKSLCENDYNLKNVLNFVNIKVIPVGCPWSFNNNSRVNENGVNINRNFATPTWHVMGEGTTDYSGASAGDQDETQIIQNWILANSDAIFYFDCHNSIYTNEISMLSGDDTGESRKAKLRYLYAINDVIPYWQKHRKIAPTNIYAYTGGVDAASSDGQVSRYYALLVGGIELSFTHEACWDIGGERNGPFAIGTGREALGNLLSGMLHYYEDL